MYKKILVAYDGSDGARAALRSAVALAGAFGGSVHLLESTGHLERAEEGIIEADPSAESSARHVLEEAADQLDEVPAVTRVVKGDPVAAIIGAAEDIHADLIVTGSRGRAMMPEAVLGSYPGQVWLWLYTFWYQISPFDTSVNADALIFALMGLLSLAFICIPFIPGLRGLPRHLGVHRLIWRDHYRRMGN